MRYIGGWGFNRYIVSSFWKKHLPWYNYQLKFENFLKLWNAVSCFWANLCVPSDWENRVPRINNVTFSEICCCIISGFYFNSHWNITFWSLFWQKNKNKIKTMFLAKERYNLRKFSLYYMGFLVNISQKSYFLFFFLTKNSKIKTMHLA